MHLFRARDGSCRLALVMDPAGVPICREVPQLKLIGTAPSLPSLFLQNRVVSVYIVCAPADRHDQWIKCL